MAEWNQVTGATSPTSNAESGYEIICRNVEFRSPPRIGLRFPSLGVSDVFRIYVQPPLRLRPAGKAARMDKKIRTAAGAVDEWQCRWEKLAGVIDDDMGQVLDPPLKTWDQLDRFPFPDPSDPGVFEGLEAALANSAEKYVQLNSPFCLFERMHFLRGFEPLMIDLYENPAQVCALAERVMDYQIGVIREAYRLGKGRIHCFDTTDDWGTQTQLFISPKLWRRIFRPLYQKLVDAAHGAGMHVRFHTDGKINSILGDLIEVGMDIINIHQPRLLGIQEVGTQYAGQVCFEASVDIQATLPAGNKAAIFAEVKQLVDSWMTARGGLIAVEYRHLQAIGATHQSLEWALEAFSLYGSRA